MKLVIVVPCYNEEEVLPETTAQLSRVLDGLRGKKAIDQGIILYVDDGSKDTTWRLVQKYATENPYVKGLKLAHNVQDDVDAIGTMVDYYNRGVDIVYGVRRERKVDTFFKKGTALAFYCLMRNLGGEIVYNHADFRLMSRRTLLALMAFPERNLFLRGIVASMGYPSAVVYYDRKERFAGESKYPLKKMISFALDGITSFSVRPLRYITYLGLFFMLIAVFAIFYGLFSYVEGSALPGWTSLLVSMWFIGGAILLACGIIGEYVGKIYKEVKQRPRYFIENETD